MTRSQFLFGQTGPVNPRTGQVMSQTYAKADKVNREGAPAFTRTLEEDTISVLTTQTLGNTFYASRKELAKELVDVISAMADKDPEFLAKALVYARTKGLMKLAPTVGLSVLAEKAGKKSDPFRFAFPNVIRIPDDLREFVTLMLQKKYKLENKNRLAKRMIQNSLRHMSEFHAIKYGSANSEGITLRDIIRLVHPSPKTPKGDKDVEHERLRNGAQAELFGWLVSGWKDIGSVPSPTNPKIWAFEKLKRSEDEKEIVSLIETYKLPWEVVVPSVKKMTVAIWKALMKGMPYMALLRNLNTFERHGVLAEKAMVDEIAKKLSDPENVKKSKQFPFRFWNAFRAYNGPQEIRDALSDALEASFQNMPEIKGMVCISNDISISMSSAASDKGDATLCEIAAIFAAALFKKCEDVVLLPFDDTAHPDLGKVSKRDTVMSITKQIGISRGGTNLGAPIELLLRERKKVDVFIGLTDNEDWSGRGFLIEWEAYKSQINPKAKAFLVTLAPYKDWVAPANYEGVWFVQGWSEAVLRYIPLILSGGMNQVDEIRAIDLKTFGRKEEAVEVQAAD